MDEQTNPLMVADNAEVIVDFEEDDEPLEIPVERRRVRTEKQDVPVETLHKRILQGRLDLQPEFQRNFVWNSSKASRLIESILLEIPIPVIYVAEEKNNTNSVVDGQQRLTSISSFLNGKFPDGASFRLTSLQVLKELNGKLFKDLDPKLQEAIEEAILRLIVIEKDSDPDVKFEIFERLNMGSVKLNDQELRNCVYRGNYNKLLEELTHNRHMLNIMGAQEPHNRMTDRQLILRFFAMCRNTHLKYKGPMKHFLNKEMEDHRSLSADQIKKMKEMFENCIEMAFAVFGNKAFRRFYPGWKDHPNGYWESSKLNVALWDTLLYSFSYFQKSQVIPIADAIREEFLDLITNDPTFVEYISSSTDKPEYIQYRADVWLQRMRALVEPAEPRTLSSAFKQQLFQADQTCQICTQRIHDLDDAEVDHIIHYWRGGKTIPDNARLTHRYCNRARGGRP